MILSSSFKAGRPLISKIGEQQRHFLRTPTISHINRNSFRTYFPDAYRTHYPNAKTHLSTRIRSFLPDGTPIFAKTRSKKRRPFSAEEDAALRRGYERYAEICMSTEVEREETLTVFTDTAPRGPRS